VRRGLRGNTIAAMAANRPARMHRLPCWLALLAMGTAAAATPHVPGPLPLARDALQWQAYRVFDSSGSLPQNSVLSLAQDRAGFVYAGTDIGLARYDGTRWDAIALDGSARRVAVGALLASADGALWIGTEALGLLRLVDGTSHGLRAADGAPASTVFDIAAIDDDEVWVAADDGLYRCAPEGCQSIDAVRGMTVRVVQAVDGPDGDSLWLGIEGEGLRRLDGVHSAQPQLSPFRLRRTDGLPNDIVVALRRWGGAGGRDLWIGTGRGFARWDGNRIVSYSALNGLPSAMVFAFESAIARNGEPLLLAAARPGGLVEVRADGNWQLTGTREGLPDGSVQSLLRERGRDTLWLGTLNGGVARVEPGRWITLDERAGLPDRSVVGTGILRHAGEEPLWIGTASGAVLWAGGRFVPLLPADFARRQVYAALRLADGSLWVATERGVLAFDGPRVSAEFTVDNSVLPAVWASELVRREAADGSEEVWVGTGHGLARWQRAGGLVRVDALPAMPRGDPVRRIAVAHGRGFGGGDALWLAAGRSLVHFDGATWTRHGGCTDTAVVEDVVVDSSSKTERVWLATRDGLRAETLDGACLRLPAADDPGAWTHVAMSGSDLFAFGAHGAWRIPDGDLARRVHFDVDDGLPTRELARGRTVVVDSAGRIFAGTVAGLAAFDPGAPAPARVAAPLRLVAASHGANGAALEDGAAIASATASVRFAFRLLSFSREHAIRYRTQLEGIDREPGPWQAEAEASFVRLPAGRYRFHVWARDADGIEAGPLVRSFAVLAPAWQRWWALLAYAAALLGLAVLAVRWRTRMIAARAHELSAEVATRTAELAAANRMLEQAAVTDPLTGLKNRRFLALELPQEAERTLRRFVHGELESDLLVILLDIDRFKAINDRYGHAAGDQVLVEVAHRLGELARNGDYVLRWGGEEFLLLLRDCDRAHARSALGRVLAGVAGRSTLADGRQVEVTVSAGAVAFPLRADLPRAVSLDASIELADAALYRAKNGGRDCAVIARWDGTAEPDAQGLRLAHERVPRSAAAPD
jgi:diguanylate cyclase (GGDEF)-like protein